MFIYHNIFFSFATDSRDLFKDYGGDYTAHRSANNDLMGIRILNKIDIPGLHTLLTAIIDYRGKRLCAQSIIPGILYREQTSTVIYGTMDNAQTITTNPDFHQLLCSASEKLHLKEHKIMDAQGNLHTICTPVEAKVISYLFFLFI